MKEACSLIWSALVLLFRSRASLAAEILVLRHQINILRRHSPKKRQTFSVMDRLIFAGLYRLAPTVLNALAVLKPDTVIKWHRAGFRSYWRWRSRRRGGRPTLPTEIRKLIREMSIANPLWGAPRIHGELLKLGIDIGQTSVAKYMVKRRGPPSQGWKTFLHNHADGIAAMDLFVVPTISFRLLYGLLIMGHGRRQILWFGVTANPTAEWIANQVTEACGWEQAPRYLIRDRDGASSVRQIRPKGADSVEKVLFGRRTKFLRTADAFRTRRREGPHRFTQKRPPTFVSALRSVGAVGTARAFPDKIDYILSWSGMRRIRIGRSW